MLSRSSSSCVLPSAGAAEASDSREAWLDAAPRVRHTLMHGMREWALAHHLPSGRHVIYWINPKAAHTRIMRLLRGDTRSAFRTLNVSEGHAGRPDERWSGGVRGRRSWGSRGRAETQLQWALSLRPFEFTFVRAPMAHLISAAAQLNSCLTSWNCINRNLSWPFTRAEHVLDLLRITQRDELPSAVTNVSRPMGFDPRRGRVVRCTAWESGNARASLLGCARHLYPQSAGFGFDGSLGFPHRLHFVGRVEHLADDWSRLLQRLHDHGDNRAAPSTASSRIEEGGVDVKGLGKIFNKRRDSLRPSALDEGADEWKVLASSREVRRWLDADLRCAKSMFQ